MKINLVVDSRTKYYYDQIKADEMGRACNTHGGLLICNTHNDLIGNLCRTTVHRREFTYLTFPFSGK
jgi:hypothetical protein